MLGRGRHHISHPRFRIAHSGIVAECLQPEHNEILRKAAEYVWIQEDKEAGELEVALLQE
jgi:hypothetical protein